MSSQGSGSLGQDEVWAETHSLVLATDTDGQHSVTATARSFLYSPPPGGPELRASSADHRRGLPLLLRWPLLRGGAPSWHPSVLHYLSVPHTSELPAVPSSDMAWGGRVFMTRESWGPGIPWLASTASAAHTHGLPCLQVEGEATWAGRWLARRHQPWNPGARLQSSSSSQPQRAGSPDQSLGSQGPPVAA